MKKVLFLLFVLFTIHSLNAKEECTPGIIADEQSGYEGALPQGNAADEIFMTISGPEDVTLKGGYAQEVYRLSVWIPGARYEWSIRAAQAFITPSENTCSVSFYSPGGARLVCDVYVGNEWVGAGTIYIEIKN